ncbi:MAG: methionyl-tRNA formyltransferase [Candidatus Rokubacteria bacterium 13_1_40CM_4_69_5]|nr:MAG: methionyl-tRNA formyltransferase [Candidatus Rokubacteria bacterium 13_1_40CM_4_69_5]
MKVLFYGTPEFALPTLDALLRRHEVVAVVTQPDRPAHRGQRLTPPPVKARATAAGLPVLQPARLREPEWPARLRALAPAVAVVVAFGQILPKAVLDVPARGSINVHASLLPRYRGAAPVARAIMRGETVTGITTFKMDEGMDTGPILLQSDPVPIGPEETAGELAARLAVLGAEVLIDTLARLDTLTPVPQRHAEATSAPRLKRSDGYLDWDRPASQLVNVIRGCNPWPGALTTSGVGRLTIWRATVVGSGHLNPPGMLGHHEGRVVISAADGAVLPIEVQPENKRRMPWAEYLRGARLAAGARFLRPAFLEP